MAVKVWNACANGMGGVDWDAVLLFADHYGVTDIDMLVERLLMIKMHKPQTPGA